MKLSGTSNLKAPRDKVWAALNDPDILRLCIPGCTQIVLAPDDATSISYDVLMEAGIGAIKGSYTGKIRIYDAVPGTQCRMTLTGNGNTGFVKAEGLVHLRDVGDETALDYSGQAQVGGLIASVGQRVIESAAKLIVGQFFKSFEAAVENFKAVPPLHP